MEATTQKETIESRLMRYFSGRGFAAVDLHAEDLKLYYSAQGSSVYLVWMILSGAVSQLSREQYQRQLDTIRGAFLGKGFETVQVLTLFFHTRPEIVKRIGEDTAFWIVDESYGRLIIYENQPEDFLGIRSMIEQNLHFGADVRNEDGQRRQGVLAESGSSVNSSAPQNALRAAGSASIRRVGGSSYGRNPGIRAVEHKSELRKQCFTLALVLVNVVVFFLQQRYETITLNGSNMWSRVLNEGEFYRLFTSMFLHADMEHLMSNMIGLYAVGVLLEERLGHAVYLASYFLTGLLASLTSCIYHMKTESFAYSIGASGAVYGIVGVYVLLMIVGRDRRDTGIFIRLGVFALLMFSDVFGRRGNIDNAAHIGGFVAGTLYGLAVWLIVKIRRARRRKRAGF